jgi:ribonuclease Z
MKLTMLGTGHALVTKYYNTCFVISDDDRYLLVDGGGGNTILRQLELAGIPWYEIRDIFVTHKHTDHLMGIVWMIRMICHELCHGNDLGDVRIYGHDEVLALLQEISEKLLQPKETAFFGNRLQFVEVTDGQTLEIIGRKMKFFDMGSTKAKQFGFVMELPDGQKMTCCGDEPYHEGLRPYAENSKWLLHEAFCLYNEREIFQPYEKHHSTVKDACELAQSLKISNLLLYHTEDGSFPHRKERYSQEGRQFYHQHLVIPDDLETIVL